MWQSHMADAGTRGRHRQQVSEKASQGENTERGCKITAEELTAVQGTPVQEAQHLGWDVQTKCVAEVRTCRERPRAQVHQYSQWKMLSSQ